MGTRSNNEEESPKKINVTWGKKLKKPKIQKKVFILFYSLICFIDYYFWMQKKSN